MDATPEGVWVGHHPLRIIENVVVPFVPGSVFERVMMVVSEVGIIFVPETFWALTILLWLYLFAFVAFTLDVIHDNAVIQAIFGAALLVPIRAGWAGLTARVIFSGLARKPEKKSVSYWDPLCDGWRIYNKIWAFYLIPMLLDDFSGCMWMNRIIPS